MPQSLSFSLVVPMHNEEDNVFPFLDLVLEAKKETEDPFEVLMVDDKSTDQTLSKIQEAKLRYKDQVLVKLVAHRVNAGQSASLRSGIQAAQAPVIITIDGDCQNLPSDAFRLYEAFKKTDSKVGLIIGNRKADRKDNFVRRLSSAVANGVRNWFLKDQTPDSGCGIKVFRKEDFLKLPYFEHIHRFMPPLFRREGFEIQSLPVQHLDRTQGKSKYGINNRLWVGIRDLFGVKWLLSRYNRVDYDVD